MLQISRSSRSLFRFCLLLSLLTVAALLLSACAPAPTQPATTSGDQAATPAAPAAGEAAAGGAMIFSRYADSLFLDPVLNDAAWTFGC
ncbi:MAG: hypothetical protein R2911_19130 [Caldilineaceae bacterium]